MLHLKSMLASGVALLAAVLSSSVTAAENQDLPWNGRFQSLTVATLKDKYLTHILTNRQSGTVDPNPWTNIKPKGRIPAFNGDMGVVALAVDSNAIFGGQTNYRRSELVQNVAGNTAGPTFFRVSLRKEEVYINLYSWQVVFLESHLFEIRIDATKNPVELVWCTGGSTETRWSTEFKTKTWYNFGIAVYSGKLDLYFSEENSTLNLIKTEEYNGDVPTSYEFHFGQLTLSKDGSAVEMVEEKQDVLLFNGVSVEDRIPSGIGSSTPITSLSFTNSVLNPASNPSTQATTDTTPTATMAVPLGKTAVVGKGVDEAADNTAFKVDQTNDVTTDESTDDFFAATPVNAKISNSGCKARRS